MARLPLCQWSWPGDVALTLAPSHGAGSAHTASAVGTRQQQPCTSRYQHAECFLCWLDVPLRPTRSSFINVVLPNGLDCCPGAFKHSRREWVETLLCLYFSEGVLWLVFSSAHGRRHSERRWIQVAAVRASACHRESQKWDMV